MWLRHVLALGPWRCSRSIAPLLTSSIVRGRHTILLRSLSNAAERKTSDVALPATPDTYLALRTSPYELYELPVTSFEALIYESGRAGLAGVMANIVDDVLHHRAAAPGSSRQQRLLLALLTMASSFDKQLPLSPDMVVRIASELMQVASPSCLPAPVAAHIMRMALLLPSQQGSQHTLIPALFQYLFQVANYPLLEEGLQVIEYSMQYGDADPHTVMNLVSQTAQVDGHRLGEQTLQQARSDGFAWRRWARDVSGWMAVGQLREGALDLQVHAQRISIWSLCCRAWLRLNRSRRFRDAYSQLRQELKTASHMVAPGAHFASTPGLAILRGLLQSHVLYLAGLHTKNALRSALATIKAVPPDEVACMKPVVFHTLCRTAHDLQESSALSTLVQTWMQAMEKANAPLPDRISLVTSLPSYLQLEVVRLLTTSNRALATQLAAWILGDAPLYPLANNIPWALRSPWLICLCNLNLVEPAKLLYMQWSHSPGTPHCHEIAANRPVVSASRRFLDQVQRALQVQPVSIRSSLSPQSLQGPLVDTPSSMIALVRLFGHTSRTQTPRDIVFARAVRDDFLLRLYAMPSPSRQAYTALMQTSFMIGDCSVAYFALESLITLGHSLDPKAMAIVLRGVADVAPNDALALFRDLDDTWHTHPQLYAVLMSRFLRAQRLDLLDDIYEMASKKHLVSPLTFFAPELLLSSSDMSPRAYVSRILRMMRDGYSPPPDFVWWAIRSAVRGVSLKAASEPNAKDKGAFSPIHLKAAMELYVHVAQQWQCIDMPTTRFLLYHVAKYGRSLHKDTNAMVQMTTAWSTLLDKLVKQIFSARTWTGMKKYQALTNITVCTKELDNHAEEAQTLPPPLVYQILLAYMALGDQHGTLEVLDWALTHTTLSQNELANAPYPSLHALPTWDISKSCRAKPWWPDRE
ncbi:hypothetical protein ACI68E_000357 [Malassezia pachydermatis]